MPDLSLVDTIVFLMMENRSFDHMLGHLTFDGQPGGPVVDGLADPLNQSAYENLYRGETYYPHIASDAALPGDVPHHRHHVATQMALSPVTDRFEMSGFAEAYFDYKPTDITEHPPSMAILPRQDVPVSTFFAESFAVCDRWFSSLPTSTQPNKLMSLEGTSKIDDTEPRVVPTDRLVIDWLTERNIRWRVYHDGLSFFALFGRTDVIFDGDLFRPFHKLADDVQNESADTYPQVIFIEPNYESGPNLGSQPNDDHAPLPVRFGQQFQGRAYEALTANPERWEKTVFVITYDEHGGFYDHVPPPVLGYVPPNLEYQPFETLGPRVPGLVVSPLVSPGTVFSEPLDHTSILQFIAERFAPGEDGYSSKVNARRDWGIKSIYDVLNLDTPRGDIPEAPQVDVGAPSEPRSKATELIEKAFEAAGHKLAEDRPDETAAMFPELWTWHQAHPAPKNIEIQGFDTLFLEHAQKKLVELPRDLARARGIADRRFTRGQEPEVSVTVGAGAGIEIQAFHSPDQRDSDGILATGPREDPHEIFPPQIELASGHAWMKYAYDADLSVGAGATLGALGIDFEAEKSLRAIDYRKHPGDAITIAVVTGDLWDPRFAVREEDVLALGAGECLSMQFIGTIGAKVELTWGDIFSSQFGNVGAILGSDQVMPIKISAGLKLSASVTFRDDLLLAFSRVEAGRLRAAVRKAKQRESNFSFESSVNVAFDNPAQVAAAMKGVVASIVGEPYEEITELLNRPAVDHLTSTEAGILLKLSKAAGLGPALPDGIAELRNRISEAKQWLADLEQTVDETIRFIAAQKVSIGFKYEYSRISTNAALLQATLTDDLLATYQPGLLKGELGELLDAIQNEVPGVQLETYLQRETLETRKSWGFTLGIGRWSVLGRDDESVVRTTDRNLEGQCKRAYHGARGYTGDWIGADDFEWGIDFRADMQAFSNNDPPKLSEYEYGLFLDFERTRKLSEDEVERVLDSAHLWGACDPSRFADMRATLAESVGKVCETVVQIRVDHAAFMAILGPLSSADDFAFCEALGAAMPWMEGYEGRRSVGVRRRLYGPLWRWFFGHPSAAGEDLARFVATHLRNKAGHDELYPLELKYQARRHRTFAGLVELNTRTIQNLAKFNEGMAILAAGIAADSPDDEMIRAVFDKIKVIGRNSHHVRALGCRVNDLVEQAGISDGVERTVTVNDGENVIVFGR